MLGNEQLHLNRVEKTLEKLRALCLGQDTRLTAILPNHLLTQPDEIQAKHISEQILFALVKFSPEPVSEEQLVNSRMWLHSLTLYLLLECNKEDQTFQQLKHLIFLSQGVRDIFIKTHLEAVCSAPPQGDPPALLKELDGAVWWLLKVQGLASCGETYHNKLINLLSSPSSAP